MEYRQHVIEVSQQLTELEDSQENISEILMAIDSRDDNMMGCALFDTSDGILHIAEDIRRSDLDLLDHFAAFTQPCSILLSTKAPREFLEYVERCVASENQHIQVVPSGEFSATTAGDKLCNWGFDMSSQSCPTDIDLWLQHNQNPVSIGCLSAVLSKLRKLSYLGDAVLAGTRSHSIRSIRTFCLTTYVLCSPETLQALQIFPSEMHAQGQSWGMKGAVQFEMESICLYNLFQSLTQTPQGRSRLRTILRNPLSNLGIIESRQKAIHLLLNYQRKGLLQDMMGNLKKIRNAKLYVDLLRKGVDCSSMTQGFSGSVWSNIRRFVIYALKLRDQIDALTNNPSEFLHKAASRIDRQSLILIGETLHSILDFQRAECDARPAVMVGVDPELDRLKRNYSGLGGLLEKIAQSIVRQVPERAAKQIKSCVFVPQVGFLIAVERNTEAGLNSFPLSNDIDDMWEKFFVADGAIHYKNNQMRHLDEQFGDIYRQITDREVEVLHRLATHVLHYDEALLEASDACGDVDVILALALAADKYKWVAPQMTSRNVIQIENGRHPLQELIVPTFIPNHCNLYGEREGGEDSAPGRCMIVTGPNSSGKSVYLKQVALIVYLAHIGSFVPADMAVIGMTDQILTRITTRESANRQDSAFAIDLKQLLYALTHMTPRSLLIIDEFGKGTNPDDGVGLLAALLEHLRSMGSSTPRCLLATHLCEVFDTTGLFSAQDFHLSYMDVIRGSPIDPTANSVVYLFKLCDGYRSDSLGGYCAAMNGVPREIVNRADLLVQLLIHHEDISISCARLSADEEKTLQLAEEVARRFIEETFDGQTDCDVSEVQQHARRSLQRIFTTAIERLR